MISLHTIENVYDDDHSYHQFVQRGRQRLLDSEALGNPGTLRSFLQGDVIEALDELDDRTMSLLERTLESGDITKLLSYAERVYMRDSGAEHVCMTRFGEWTFDTVVIEPPSLRELQEDMWASDEQFPREDWQHEVREDAVLSGYWEWVEHMRESEGPAPRWKVGDHVTWTAPDDGVCSRTGVLTAVSELGDFNLAITMEDGWMAEVCESELKRVP